MALHGCHGTVTAISRIPMPKSSGICGVARARHQSGCAACNGLSLIIVVLKGAFELAVLCMLRAQIYPKHVSVICKMRPIPAEHPSQPGDQPDASTDEEAMSLDETADEELESSSDQLTTTDENEEPIELCPYCEESISYNTIFEPTLHSREQLRSGYTPSAHSCRRLIERAEAAEEQAAQLYDETRRLQSLMKELHHRRRLLVRFSKEQRALASPIRRLPTELLLDIFRRACVDSILLFPAGRSELTAASRNAGAMLSVKPLLGSVGARR